MTPAEAVAAEAVAAVRSGASSGVLRDISFRRTQLRQIARMLTENEDRWLEALRLDLGKPAMEAYGAELSFVCNDVHHALKHLDDWLKPTKVALPLTFRPGSARIVTEPLGTVLVIAPWNYPVQLLLAPLVPALAAGNTAVLKPSEIAAATSALMAELVPRYLDERVVRVVTGGADQTTALLTERFDHILYTGNEHVARIVMTAAARHLTPVTLELGGKSPTIVHSDADIEVAARRIAWGKFLNAGQTCIAPDYVLVHESVEDQFLGAMIAAVKAFYGTEPKHSDDYARIVNLHHFDRLTALLDGGGFEATVVGGHGDRESRYIPPTVLGAVSLDAPVMSEEIFGPILPVLTYSSIDDAIAIVNSRPKPLALYVFATDRSVSDRVIERTSSGGVCVNQTILHIAVPDLPFGGVGASGMGSYHGKAGFDTFSHRKPILDKPFKPDPAIMYPPYRRWKERIVRRLL